MTNQEFLESITQEGEEWRDVIGFEGYYMVSSYGRVVSLSRTTLWGKQTITTKTRLLKPSPKGWYPSVYLSINGNGKSHNVHRLVAEAFIPRVEGKNYIDHIDTNGHNNHVSNLHWVTARENRLNPITRRKSSLATSKHINELHPCSKKVIRIKIDDPTDVKIYPSASETHRQGFSQGNVSSCCRGEVKSYRGYYWHYLSDYEAHNQ